MDPFLLQLRAMCYGLLIAFFIATIVRLLPAIKKQRNANGRFLMRVLVATMMLLSVKNLIRFAMDTNLIVHPGMEAPAIYEITTLLEMMAIPLMGVSLMTIVKAQHIRLVEMAFELMPLMICVIALLATGEHFVVMMASWYVVLYTIGVIIYVHFAARRYERWLNDTYANTGRRGVTWVLATLYILVGLVVIWYVLRYLYPSLLNNVIYNLLSLVPWLFYAMRLMKQDFNTHDLAEAMAAEDNKETSQDEESDKDTTKLKTWQEPKFGEAIRQFCTEEKNFTNTDLSIVDVAQAVGSNRTYVSRWCKEQGLDFSTFVAHIRLDRAEQLLLNTDLTINEVVAMTGFSNPRTFRNSFVARHGCTPSEFRQQKSE